MAGDKKYAVTYKVAAAGSKYLWSTYVVLREME